ncbi:MAG: hypothetical protein JZU63_08580, partial [Rhodoferax sp.]|nr:hypothetical protein [Rhodoferax sp.]
MSPYAVVQSSESELQLAGKLLALTIACSYVPAVTSYLYYKRGQEEGGGGGFSLPTFGGKGEVEVEGSGGVGLSMADVKKFGVSGTVAYILTELAFWAVAFPVASTALYRTTGHWPDVINDVDDRTAVLAFVFAGANIARLLVPLRL